MHAACSESPTQALINDGDGDGEGNVDINSVPRMSMVQAVIRVWLVVAKKQLHCSKHQHACDDSVVAMALA
eukprot:15431585-Alexandrium_andersonii.AAC.1